MTSEKSHAMDTDSRILVQVDKTVVTISGLSVKGLNIQQVESLLRQRLKTLIRIIGVYGDSLEMDVYGLDEATIKRDEKGVIKAIALADGITVSDVTRMSSVTRIKRVDFDHIPLHREGQCLQERWIGIETQGSDSPHR